MAVTAGVSAPRSVMINGQNVALSAQDQVSTSGTVTTVVAKSDDGGGVGNWIKTHLFTGSIYGPNDPIDKVGKKIRDATGLGGIADAAKAAGGVTFDLLSALTDPKFWERLLIGALGFFLILIGVVFMIESNKTARSLTEMAVVA